MTETQAAERLGMGRAATRSLVASGQLLACPESDSSGSRFVTRASVHRVASQRCVGKVASINGDRLAMSELRALTGMTEGRLVQLVTAGLLVRADVPPRRWAVTSDSVRTWATGYRPEPLALLPGVTSRDAS